MSVTFTKLFSSITESTVWCEPNSTRIAWITMLAMADCRGRIWASIPGLANRARITVEETEVALDTFLSPDRYSRTDDHEGRRIEAIDGGWRLLNYDKYRAVMNEETIAENNRKRQQKHREEEKKRNAKSHAKSVTVTENNAPSRQEEEEEEEERNKSIVESSASDQIADPSSSEVKQDLKGPVKEGWDYFLERTGKSPKQYLFNHERQKQGLKGFEALVAFAKRCGSPDPLDAASQLFRAAVDRLADSPFHNGKNDRGTRYLDWHQLFSGKGYSSPSKLVEFWLDDARWAK